MVKRVNKLTTKKPNNSSNWFFQKKKNDTYHSASIIEKSASENAELNMSSFHTKESLSFSNDEKIMDLSKDQQTKICPQNANES